MDRDSLEVGAVRLRLNGVPQRKWDALCKLQIEVTGSSHVSFLNC